MGTLITFGQELHAELLAGARLAARLVGSAAGPRGRPALVERPHHPPILVRDGHRLLQQVDLESGPAQMALLALRELAWRTEDALGDGSSAAVLAAVAALEAGVPALAAGVDAGRLREAMRPALEEVLAGLRAAARPLRDHSELEAVATEAAADDAALGRLVAGGLRDVGPEGTVLVAESTAGEDETVLLPGLHVEQGWLSSAFAGEDGSMELDDPLILLHRHVIDDLGPLVRVLEMIAARDRSLLVVAEDVTGQALTTLIVNRRDAGLKVAAIKAPGLGDWRAPMLADLAIATGGTVIDPALGTSLATLRPTQLGRAKRAIVRRDTTLIEMAGGAPELLETRRQELRRAIVAEKHLSYDREQHQKRLARLSGGICTLRIGGRTESEARDRQDRARRALASARAAQKDGVVPQAAAIRLAAQAAEKVEGSLAGRVAIRMLQAAAGAPMAAVAANAGQDGAAIVRALAAEEDIAYDVITNAFRSGTQSGLDLPCPLAEAMLRNGLSVAMALLGADAAIATGLRDHTTRAGGTLVA